MSLIRFNFESQYLHGNTEVGIILPDKPRTTNPREFYLSGEKYKVLWLLHGAFGDYSDWLRKSMIETYACENDLVVVMPSALNSSYTNWDGFAQGYSMYDFVLEELMPLVYGWLPVSQKREDNFIAGLSMGGGGTLKFALTAPERFAAAAVLSSCARDLEAQLGDPEQRDTQRMKNTVQNHGGVEKLLASKDNTWRLTKEMAGKDLPRMFFAMGEKDFGYEAWKAYRAYCEKVGFEATWESIPGYAHEWRFWDITIQHALAFFGLNSRDKGNAF